MSSAVLPILELDQQQIDGIEKRVPGGLSNVQDVYPLSPLQKGMLFHHLQDKQQDSYVLSTLFELQSQDQVQQLVAALQIVVDRHDALRTAILWEQLPHPIQVVHRSAIVMVEEIALDINRNAIEQLRARLRPEAVVFDLQRAPLIRLQVAEDRHCARRYALLRFHHVICDYQSWRAAIAEVLSCIDGPKEVLPSPLGYRRFIEETLAAARLQNSEAFFCDKLGSADETTAPFGVFDVAQRNGIIEARLALGMELARAIRKAAKHEGLSPARLFHAAWALVVAQTSGRDEAIFGTVVSADRSGKASKPTSFGLCVNTLPIRLRLQEITAKELLRHTDQELTELLAYAHTPLTLAQRCSGIRAGAPLFTALLNYRHNAPIPEPRTAGIHIVDSGEAFTSYPITLVVDDLGEGFSLIAQTDSRIDPRRLMAYLQTALQSLVRSLQQASDTPALMLQILPEGERREVLELFNATQVTYPQSKLIHELFQEQVKRTPDAIALVYEGELVTYADLNGRANQLGQYLRGKGIGPDQLVGICVERSVEMIVGLLGTLKAGGAYVPLDPHYPPERLQYMLEDAGPKVLLIQDHLRAELPQTAAQMIALDKDWSTIEQQANSTLDARPRDLRPDHLAYVIYTSGSTGRPKGAMNAHRGVVNRLQWMQDRYNLGPEDRVLQKTPFSFDVSVWEFFWPLMVGARLIVARPEGHKDPTYLQKLIEETGVTTLHFVPSMLQSFLNHYRPGTCSSLRHIVCSGEELSVPLQKKFFECMPKVSLSNLYGPTEAAVDVTAWECRPDDQSPRVPIGRPISNVRMYVLDRYGQPVPIGVTGELFIAGVCVGRGYLNQPRLTEERFIRDPFNVDSDKRMYKTGDLGRWRPDGSIEYLGRNDHQVKIRGFRIELGEIEAQLTECDEVERAVVVAREDVRGDKRLVAYVIVDSAGADGPFSVERLRSYLYSVLPDHMVPVAFVVLDSFPLSPNGKLDRRALPAPELDAYVTRHYEAPQGEIEEILAGIWQTLLRVERVGRHDKFFELGGDSLLILQMMERLHQLGLSAEIRCVFESANLADLASMLTRGMSGRLHVPPNQIPADCKAIRPEMLPLVELEERHIDVIARSVPGGTANIQDIYPLAPLQEGILFHHILDAQRGDTYVLTSLLKVSTRDRLEELVAALQAVIDRHDILRSAVLWQQLPKPVQVVCRQATLPIEESALERGQDPIEQVKEWLRPDRQRLDLSEAPLIRLRVAADPQSEQWHVLLQLHHIICDHVTADIVVSEVVAYLEGRGESLPEPVAYRNHVAQAMAHARTHDAEAFFRSKLSDVDEPTASFGLLDVYADGSRVEEAQLKLEPTLAQRTRIQARRRSVSVATLFHAAWGLDVAGTSGRDDVVFGSVLLGRLQGIADTKRVGLFVNTLPLRLPLRNVTAKDLVQRTQRELIELLDFEQASLVKAQRCSGIVGSTPLFNTLLNYRHSAPKPDAQWDSAKGIRLLAIQDRTNYPITLSVDDLGDGFLMTAQTDRRVEPQRVIRYLDAAVKSLVEALEQAPQTLVLSLSILPESERHQVINVFNNVPTAYQQNKLIHELFEEKVRCAPTAVAAVYGEQQLTYAEVNGRANQLAHYLKEKGIGPDQLVAICVERSLEMLVGLIGILKAGGAYVPLDPSYPIERLQYMLSDSTPKVLLTQERLRETLPKMTAEVITLDQQWSQIALQPSGNLDSGAPSRNPHQLAYVIYTSGSTGQPKGVMVEHGNVTRLFDATQEWFGFNEGDVWTLFHSFAFDFSVWELWGALLYGGRVVVVPHQTARSPQEFYHLLCREGVTVLNQTPSAFLQLIDAQAESSEKHALRVVIFGGEALELRTLRPWVTRNGIDKPRLVNMYGITETTVHVTYRPLTEKDVKSEQSSIIGRPIPDLRAYVLDSNRQPTPIGVAGEIYVGGPGVSRGYLKRPELTAQRFVPDRFSADPQGRLYKTGDLARWRQDGVLEYVGRNDEQVKVRGYRIELGEIETHLRQHPQVRQAIVLAREDAPGDKRLMAYVVGDRHASLKALSEAAPENLRDEVISEWETLYDETYATEAPITGPSFVGWNSSYTSAAIPEPQMQEWLDNTIERIRSLQPQKVLEIGCGVGLLLQHLAPRCSVYVGTDFSAAALAQVKRWTGRRPELKHVELLHRSATNLKDLQAGSFDVVVLNSVVQYFPDVEYLVSVLQESVRLLTRSGKIFIGDVRHLGLLPMFHAAVQLSRAATSVTVGQLRNRITRAVGYEKELAIDPQFFQDLPGRISGIRSAEVQLKRGQAANELMRYRYDVVLHTGEPVGNSIVCNPLEWQRVGLAAAQFHTALEERRWHAVRLISIPNARLVKDAEAQRLIEISSPRLEAGALRHQLNELQVKGVDPDMFWELGQRYGYDVQVRWCRANSPECFEVQLVDRARPDQVPRAVWQSPDTTKPWSVYANDPLENSFRQQLIPHLREFLKSRLPEYMVPSGWMILRQLPLTPNGKLDRRELPAPQTRPEDMSEYVAPRTDLERTLANILAEVLRVDQVGIQDNFFEIGGHSLLATRAISRIRDQLHVEIALKDLFEAPTVEGLVSRIAAIRHTHLSQDAIFVDNPTQAIRREIAEMSDSEVLAQLEKLEDELGLTWRDAGS